MTHIRVELTRADPNFADTKLAQTFHQQMLRHCSDTFSPTTNWLSHLDVDEFITQSPTLYGPAAPYSPSASTSTADSPPPPLANDWRYPLHDLLARPTNNDSACIPIPAAFKYRNVGVRTLAVGQGVLDTQTARDVVHHGNLPEKVSRFTTFTLSFINVALQVLIHTAFSSSFVEFSGPHSCRVNEKPAPEGVSREIRNSQGVKIQDGGTYQTTRLPTEPLAIARTSSYHSFARNANFSCSSRLLATRPQRLSPSQYSTSSDLCDR